MMDALSALEYPHWMMVAGAGLVVLGFIGFAFGQNRNVETDQKKLGPEKLGPETDLPEDEEPDDLPLF